MTATTTTLGITELAKLLSQCPEGQPARTLSLIAGLSQMNDRQIAEKAGKATAYVQMKRTGKRQFRR